jgi:hypothetical protein
LALVVVLTGSSRVKRSPSAVTLGALAATVLVMVLSGCSMLGGEGAHASQAVPGGPSPAVTAASGAASARTAGATPTVTPTADAAAPVPPTVPGYTLAAPKDAVTRRFQTVAGQFKGVFTGIASRTVVKGNQQVGSLVLLGLQPDLVGNTRVEQRLVPGMIKGMSGQGAKVTEQKIDGQSVAVATTKSTHIVGWYRSGAVVLVLGNGTNPATSLAFAKSYLAVR